MVAAGGGGRRKWPRHIFQRRRSRRPLRPFSPERLGPRRALPSGAERHKQPQLDHSGFSPHSSDPPGFEGEPTAGERLRLPSQSVSMAEPHGPLPVFKQETPSLQTVPEWICMQTDNGQIYPRPQPQGNSLLALRSPGQICS